MNGGEARTSARELALDILVRVTAHGAYSQLLLNERLRSGCLSAEDAALVTELVYGTLKRQNTLDFFLDLFLKRKDVRMEVWVRPLLRMSAYQLLFLEKIPDYAAVSEAVAIAKRRGHAGVASLVNAVLRNMARNRGRCVIPDGLPLPERLALVHSHPVWMVNRWVRRFGLEIAERMLAANNEKPRFALRVNPLRVTREALVAELRDAGYDAAASVLAPEGVVVSGGAGGLVASRWHEDGLMTVQDESSMLVAAVVDPQPGMRVLDACAAPGGKATHLAERMADRGEVWACDVHEGKIGLIRRQAERLGLRTIHAFCADARRLAEAGLPESFDRVLLDAPCSGLGVLRRKPEARWRKTEDQIRELSVLQAELLDSVCRFVRPGGLLVYSTCTIEPEENEDQIRAFLSRHPDFELDPFPAGVLPGREDARRGMALILPHEYGSDGFFIARLRRR
ncbi:MAG: 16S rRNA (cytosine(967)-C(5))-methyltransferase [Candidatus Reconcilbacillus cellulovorans]|uniref:16S rRNA (cytosine(967)-C(5))-methyltransferase n=1 Tax=Candidatus Reconcilbacillus cellulovorans TaxID=1906605 RepID=A0A2A6E4J5_9BACL|nr:MAG: 16S rRNA (cytosine(967)-C(5))-methyltransferase [Candidatus Reconcilbacillus cellulovorans]